jgi:serine/threonine protein kinase
MIGRTIGNYRILEKLSEGGMGDVYKALDTKLDREVAVKVLKPELARQSSVLERFRAEALTLAKLNHPNIATLHSFFDHENELFMILEFVPGETLDKVLQRRGAISCEEAIPIFSELLDSIDHAHEFGVIHRDIKPSNIMLTEKGTLKVLDFGIARLQGRARITRVGNILGTLEYMSPEQARGEETDVRSDVYSLGMTLHEILTGKTPFETENDFELIQKQINETPPRPRQINPDIPEKIEAAIIKAYAKNPDERFQTAGEFRRALLEAYSEISNQTTEASVFFADSLRAKSSQLGISQATVFGIAYQEMSIDLPETPTVEILREDRFYVSTTGSFEADKGIEKADLIQNELPANSGVERQSHIRPSFLDNSIGKRLGIAMFGILVLLVSLGASTFIFFKSEKSEPQSAKKPTTITEQFQERAENKQTVETKPEAKKQQTDAPTMQISSLSVPVQSSPQAEPSRAKANFSSQRKALDTVAKPRRTASKKEDVRLSEAKQLRQAEKVLTGF